jgi:hypothetical protein
LAASHLVTLLTEYYNAVRWDFVRRSLVCPAYLDHGEGLVDPFNPKPLTGDNQQGNSASNQTQPKNRLNTGISIRTFPQKKYTD